MKRKYLFLRLVCLTLFLALFFAAFSYAQDPIETLTLKKIHRKCNQSQSRTEIIQRRNSGGLAVKKAQTDQLFPHIQRILRIQSD